MNKIIKQIKTIKPREAIASTLSFLENHTVTMLIVLAGILVGMSLYSVNNLTNSTGSQLGSTKNDEVALTQQSLQLNEETVKILLELKKDNDVVISSNIASYRRSAFSSDTEESSWVIGGAELLEKYKAENGLYPETSKIILALQSQSGSFSVTDPSGKAINASGSLYSYDGGVCSSDGCESFTLTSKVGGGSIYQLGETDWTKRDWINSTASALGVWYKSEGRNYYPKDNDFIEEMTTFYPELFKEEFVNQDPEGIEVNKKESSYSYRGVDCDNNGCRSFVLRTNFKDGASYFQQSL